MDIEYKINFPITASQFIEVLNRSNLGERRPVDDLACINGMIENSNLVISAWLSSDLVGIARSITDFHYACYLSDLAVDNRYQNKGIGKRLQKITLSQLGPKCKLILLAAPDANEYYRKLGYENNNRGWVVNSGHKIK